MENIWETALKCTGNKDFNTIKVSIYYDLGGMSYFTHKKNERGYYVSVRPTLITNNNGYTTEAFKMIDGGGYKHHLIKCSRKTKKLNEEAIELGIKFYPQMVDYICQEQGLEICKEEV